VGTTPSRRWRAIARDARVLVGASCVVFLIGCGASGGASGSPMPTGRLAHDAELLQGRKIFAANCATCHGAAGGGALGPKFTGGNLLRDYPDIAAQIVFVEHGRGVMPAWKHALSPAELHAVVRYEREVLAPRK
jgi:mono/diheme cytochrome c family protein